MWSEIRPIPWWSRSTARTASGPVRRVLVLYPRASSAYDTAITEILRTFSAKEINATVDVINFELNDAKGKASLSAAEQNRTELVFGMGSESAAWLYQNYMKGKLPVVTVCAKDPVQLGQMKDYESGSGNNFAFTSLNVPVDVQMSYVRDLRPDLKNIAVLVDSKNISAVQTQAEPVANYLKEKGVQVIIGFSAKSGKCAPGAGQDCRRRGPQDAPDRSGPVQEPVLDHRQHLGVP